MSKQLVKKFKWWWVWQDGMHERWLQEQARQGLHLHASDPLGIRMTFERGAPADMAYRWDFPGVKADPVYTQLFVDGGWERVVDVGGGVAGANLWWMEKFPKFSRMYHRRCGNTSAAWSSCW